MTLITAGIEVKGGADGVFGVATSVSIGKFQSANGLNVTTALDAPTAAALGSVSSKVVHLITIRGAK